MCRGARIFIIASGISRHPGRQILKLEGCIKPKDQKYGRRVRSGCGNRCLTGEMVGRWWHIKGDHSRAQK